MKYDKKYVNQHPKLDKIAFWQSTDENGWMCQWYDSPFTVNGVKYNCAEQYMMAQKAKLFNDDEVYNLIMGTRHAATMKKYGRMIKNFDSAVWDREKCNIVFQGNLNKFTQNDNLCELLLDTKDAILYEASPYDRVWGIGSDKFEKWNGENLLGFILMEVRDVIRNMKYEWHSTPGFLVHFDFPDEWKDKITLKK